MPVEAKMISKAVEEAKNRKKRGFVQSVDLVVNLHGIDLKSPAAKINELVELPNPVDKDVSVCVIATGQLASEAKRAGADMILQKENLEALGKDRKAARKIAEKYGFFLAEVQLMPLVGKSLGSFLGPKGKMPTPIQPNLPVGPVIESRRRMVTLRLKDQPIIQCRVGAENMPTDKIVENIQAVLRKLEEKLEHGSRNFGKLYVKATMGDPSLIQDAGKQK